MSLPVMTDIADVDRWTTYLRTKATGATVKESEGVLGKPPTDGRKISALIEWGIIHRQGDKILLTSEGRSYAIGDRDARVKILQGIIPRRAPYLGTLEWAGHNDIATMTSADVAARWVQYNREDVGTDNENSLGRMAVCFFHLLQGAAMGTLIVGRHGMPTRFDLDLKLVKDFIGGRNGFDEALPSLEAPVAFEQYEDASEEELPQAFDDQGQRYDSAASICQVFVGHGQNLQILEQVKELLIYGRFEPIVAEDEESTAVPVPRKVLGAMRRSQAGVINVSAETQGTDGNGNTRFTINQNVLTEIGAAFVLYDEKVVLLVDRRVALPSNLQGIYRCEYEGDSLNFEATMKLLKALNNFRD